eukprot:1893944-Pyramimonas_sp.AAC.1
MDREVVKLRIGDKRCGWSAVMLHANEAEVACGKFGTLPPPCQSSQRSELFALLLLLTLTEGNPGIL